MTVPRWILSIATLFATVAVATAHDFWLIPNAFVIASGGEVIVHGQTSSLFPTSESAVTTDRLTLARVFGATDDETITALSTQDRSVVLRHRPSSPGQKIVAASLDWRNVNETAESFRKYLVLEGAEDALTRYEQAGALPTAPIVRRYAKYAKTVVEVGDGPRAFHRVIGQPLEFVPLADPRDARAAARLGFRLLFQGRPLARARIHAEMAPSKGSKSPQATELISGDDGTVDIALKAAGLWNVRTIHVVPAPKGAGADWEVHWATFVFEVR
jgi:uncharacterized GH25 family protein